MTKVKNVFFIQRAAIDVLLMHQATALEICTYLVISKYTDRHGFYSGVGHKTIKERLGVGQTKIDQAVKRLRNMEHAEQRLLYSCGEWMFKETGSLPADKHDVGWVRGWFESEYNHQVWLMNDLVGCNGDKISPLKYFLKFNRDNHARLFLLMHKYFNRKHAGVNYKLASITTQIDTSTKINGVVFRKGSMSGYHVGDKLLNVLDLSERETIAVSTDLQKSGFLNVSLSAIGDYETSSSTASNGHNSAIDENPDITPKIPKKKPTEKQRNAQSKYMSRLAAFNAMKKIHPDLRVGLNLAIKHSKDRRDKTFSIGLKKVLKTTPVIKFGSPLYDNPPCFPAQYSATNSCFVYRLDYKSTDKKAANVSNCLARKVEDVVVSGGLEPASRAGKFYKSYWWFEPDGNAIDVIGVLTPTFASYHELATHSKAQATIDKISAFDSYSIEEVDEY